jgi:hypothetical protein
LDRTFLLAGEAAASPDPAVTDTGEDGSLDGNEMPLGSEPLDPISAPHAIMVRGGAT